MAKGKGVTRIEGETTRQRSVRLANKRVSAAVKYLELVGNLAGTGYQLSPEEKDKMLKAVKDSVERMEARFQGKAVANDRFRL